MSLAADQAALTSFKYRTGAAAARCLSEGTIYFASPTELNDSLEASFDVADPESYLATIGEVLTNLSMQRGGPAFELRAGTDERQAFAEVNAREASRFTSACQQVGIYSTALHPGNQPMWSYYCNNQMGVCLRLGWTKEILQEYQLFPTLVAYSAKTRTINRADDVRSALLELALQNPSWNLAQLRAFSLSETFRRRVGVRSVARAVSIKHTDWEHEHEIRVLAPRSGLFPLMSEVLRSVIFARTDFPEWGSIMMLLHRLYPSVEIEQIAFSHRQPFVVRTPMTTTRIPMSNELDSWWIPASGGEG